MEEKRYVLILDKDRDFVRLFKSDCPHRPLGEVQWTGDHITVAYEHMIRLNKDRKPTVLYKICKAERKGKVVFKYFKDVAKDGWKTIATASEFDDAKDIVKNLKDAENKRLSLLANRLGLRSSDPSKFSATDVRYLNWYESNINKSVAG